MEKECRNCSASAAIDKEQRPAVDSDAQAPRPGRQARLHVTALVVAVRHRERCGAGVWVLRPPQSDLTVLPSHLK